MSSPWGCYFNRVEAHGGDFRNAALVREQRTLGRKLPRSLSYFNVDIYPSEWGYNIESKESREHMFQQNVSIANSDNLNEKFMFSMPNENIRLGSLVHWMDNFWLAVERDANNEVYTRVKLLQCNHLLKWLLPDKTLMEQWSVVEDGTKLMQPALRIGNNMKSLFPELLGHPERQEETTWRWNMRWRESVRTSCIGQSAAKPWQGRVQRPSQRCE